MAGASVLLGVTLVVWFIFCVVRPLEYLRWLSWKKRARLAISNKQTSQCRICRDYIFPGEIVVKVEEEGTNGGFLVHVDKLSTPFNSGGSFSIKSRYRVCAILVESQQGLGTWDGSHFLPAD